MGGGGGGQHFGLRFVSCSLNLLWGSGGMPLRNFCALRQLLVQSEAKIASWSVKKLLLREQKKNHLCQKLNVEKK